MFNVVGLDEINRWGRWQRDVGISGYRRIVGRFKGERIGIIRNC